MSSSVGEFHPPPRGNSLKYRPSGLDESTAAVALRF